MAQHDGWPVAAGVGVVDLNPVDRCCGHTADVTASERHRYHCGAAREAEPGSIQRPASATARDQRSAWTKRASPFFELYAYALRGRPGTEGFLDGIVESWVAPVAGALIKAGADERTARADARLGVAVVRGLLLDLLATGDRAGVSEAYERFLARAWASAAPAPGSGSRPPQP